MSENLRQIEIGHNLQDFLNSMPFPVKADFKYTRRYLDLDGYTFGGLTVAIDFEYSDDKQPTPRPAFLLSSLKCDPNHWVVPFGAETPLDETVGYIITGFAAKHFNVTNSAVR